jgi:hypothetical protein
MNSTFPPFVQAPPLPDTDQSCEQDMQAFDPQASGARATVATVIQVEPQLGVLKLETEIGPVLLFVAPDKLKNVQEGDQLVVCLAETDPAEEVPSDATTA